MQVNLSEIESSRKDTFHAVETLAKRIEYVRNLRGLTQEEFAEELGVSRGAVGNWELGGGVSGDNLSKIIDRYDGLTLDWLKMGRGEPPGDLRLPAAPSAGSEPQNASAGPPVDLSHTVPLMGQGAAGPDGRFPFNGEKVADISASPKIAGVRDAYAIYVIGDSMEDRYFHGEVVFANPHKPYSKGSFVVAQIAEVEGEPPSGYIKRFVSYDDKHLKLEQLNPKKIMTFPSAKVVSIHRIIMGGEE